MGGDRVEDEENIILMIQSRKVAAQAKKEAEREKMEAGDSKREA